MVPVQALDRMYEVADKGLTVAVATPTTHVRAHLQFSDVYAHLVNEFLRSESPAEFVEAMAGRP